MKKFLIFGFALLAFACKNKEAESLDNTNESSASETVVSEGMPAASPEKLGEAIFNGKGNCATCHNIDTKSIGPSVKEISKVYKEKNSSIVAFLRGEAEAIVDPDQYEVMKANFAITKDMSDDELKSLEAYMNSHLK
jgi:cytochrome c